MLGKLIGLFGYAPVEQTWSGLLVSLFWPLIGLFLFLVLTVVLGLVALASAARLAGRTDHVAAWHRWPTVVACAAWPVTVLGLVISAGFGYVAYCEWRHVAPVGQAAGAVEVSPGVSLVIDATGTSVSVHTATQSYTIPGVTRIGINGPCVYGRRIAAPTCFLTDIRDGKLAYFADESALHYGGDAYGLTRMVLTDAKSLYSTRRRAWIDGLVITGELLTIAALWFGWRRYVKAILPPAS
ncbi:MAG: hypothetical protein H7338_10990 [Candidatus Sericytochromatia bacterium]|nr:hypothetical protein [Candidatus Sericytochromatia bacterium]